VTNKSNELQRMAFQSWLDERLGAARIENPKR
jgi:hypothetical protein